MSWRTPVFVYASDPMSAAGAKAQLMGQPAIELVGPADLDRTRVALVVVEAVDESAAKLVRTVLRDGVPSVLLVASRFDEAGVIDAVAAGVTAFLRRSEATTARLVDAIRQADQSGCQLPEGLLKRAASKATPTPPASSGSAPLSGLSLASRLESTGAGASAVDGLGAGSTLTALHLSAREEEVIRLVAEGYDTGQISERLVFSDSTIKSVLAKLMARFEARNRCHLVAIVVREGLI